AMITPRRRADLKRPLVMALVSLLCIAPITVRNYIVYREFVPISIGVGLNLWEGIGDYSGDRFGAVAEDHRVAEQEAVLYDNPQYRESWAYPDGISRDRARIRKSFAVIVRHPLWYAGVMLNRMGEMVKYSAHAPLVFRSTDTRLLQQDAQIRRQWRDIASPPGSLGFAESMSWMRLPIRGLQRTAKETALLFILLGVAIMFVGSWRRSLFLLMTPLYYLLFQSAMHTEFRYTLPMHYFLFVFAAIVWVLIGASVGGWVKGLAGRAK
ncbi:MAG: hypothetical protein WAV20_21155, partial [Blastocatellia bacterium]